MIRLQKEPTASVKPRVAIQRSAISQDCKCVKSVRRQTPELSSKIGVQLFPVFNSRKLKDDLKHMEHNTCVRG